MNGKTNFRGHVLELDALRAVGICVVLLNHTIPSVILMSYPTLWQTLALGWAFMDSFFVLSGFLITGILLDTKHKPHFLGNFFARRALRILPLYYGVLAVILAVYYLRAQQMPEWGSPLWFVVYMGNLPTALTGMWPSAVGGALSPLWSLQIEEQFYLLFPFLVLLLSRHRLGLVLGCLVLGSVGLRIALYLLFPDNHLVQYVALPCHMDGLALGGLLAILYRAGDWRINRIALSAVAAALIGATVGVAWLGGWFYHTPLVRTVGFLVASLASVAVVMWLIEFRGSRLTAPLRNSFVQYLGKISYGLYMLHWLVLAVVSWYFPGYHQRRDLWGCALVLGITLAIAALSWRFLESPLLTLKDRFTRTAPQGARGSESAL